MRFNHFPLRIKTSIVHTSGGASLLTKLKIPTKQLSSLSIFSTFYCNFTGAIMEYMIIVTMVLLAVVVFNEIVDH